MDKLFLGVLFTLLDFHLDVGSMRIGLLPDFLGYLFLQQGVDQLAGESACFQKARPWATGLMIYSLVLYLADLFSLSLRQEVLLWALGLLYTAAHLLVLHRIIGGIGDLEMKHGGHFGCDKLKSLWLYITVLNGIAYLSNWLPVVGVIAMLAALIINICFTVAFYQTKEQYRLQTGE